MSNDWVDSLKTDEDDDLQKFLFDMFIRADDAHEEAVTLGNRGDEIYHQAGKDMIRRILAFRNINLEVGSLIGSSPTNQCTVKEVNGGE